MTWLQPIINLFKKRPTQANSAAAPCYAAIVVAARAPRFYESGVVPDTPQGRFEMVLLHAWLVIDILANSEPEFTQDLFDLLFADFDDNLRELGVGDLAIGHRVKGWAAAFYGRAAAYKSALYDEATLTDTLVRNLRSDPGARPQVRELAYYVQTAHKQLHEQDAKAIMAGTIQWPE